MEAVEKSLNLIEPLLVDQEDQPDDLQMNEDFAEEQALVARFVNLIHAPTTDQQFLVNVRRLKNSSTPLKKGSYSVSQAKNSLAKT